MTGYLISIIRVLSIPFLPILKIIARVIMDRRDRDRENTKIYDRERDEGAFYNIAEMLSETTFPTGVQDKIFIRGHSGRCFMEIPKIGNSVYCYSDHRYLCVTTLGVDGEVTGFSVRTCE